MSSYIYMLIFIVLILFVIFLKQLLTTEEIKKKEYDAKIEDGINDPENPKIYGVSRFRKAMFLERLDGNGTNYLQMAISVGGDKSENIQENIENIFDGVDTLYIGSITVDSEDYKNREGVPLPYSVYLRVAVPGKSNLEKVYNDIIKELQNSKAYQENSIRLPPLPGYFYFTTETQEISGGDKETVITTPVYTEYIKPELNEKEWGTVNKNKLEPERGEDFPSTGGGIDEVNNLGIEDEGDEVEIGEDGLPTSYGRVNEDSNYDGVFGFKYDNNKAVKAYVKEGATDVPGIGGYMVGTPGRGKSYALCSIIEEFLNKNPKSCPVLFDTPRDNIFSFLYPNNEPNKLEQKRINKFKENPQWDFNPKNYPIKVFLLGTNEKDNPCDEIFQINTQELNNKEFFKLIGSVYDDDLSPAQRRNLRKIKEIADTYKADGYNINDLKEIVIELENNAVKYKDILMKTNSEEDIENNKIMKSSTSSVLVDKLYILHKQLGDILVRNGGNDPFEDVLNEGIITTFIYDSVFDKDTQKRNALVSYILRTMTSELRNRGSIKEMKYPIFIDEAQDYIKKGTPTKDIIESIIKEDRKYGVNIFLTFLYAATVKGTFLTGICDYLKIVFPPTSGESLKNTLQLFRDEYQEDISQRFKESKKGLAVFDGRSTNINPWAWTFVKPKQSTNKLSDEEKEEIMSSQKKWNSLKKECYGDIEEEDLEQSKEDSEDDELKELEEFLDDL